MLGTRVFALAADAKCLRCGYVRDCCRRAEIHNFSLRAFERPPNTLNFAGCAARI